MKKIIFRLLVLCISLTLCNFINVFAENISAEYTFVRTDDGRIFRDVAIGTHTCVVVGKNGRIYYEENDAWKQAECGVFEDFKNVEFADSKFVAVSDSIVAESLNGSDWYIVSEDNDFSEDGVFVFNNNEFLIEKSDGIYCTTNFIEYTQISSVSSKINKYYSLQPNFLTMNNSDDAINLDYFHMIFGANNITDTVSFNKKLALFLNLSGIDVNTLPVNVENIEFAEINGEAFVVYYIRDFALYKAETVDFNTWTEIVVNLPEQNIILSNVMIGKMNDNYVLVYDTNELAGIYAMKKYMLSTDLASFDEITTSNVRGDVIANNGKIFVLTSSDIYMVKNNAIAPVLESENIINEKNSVITTNNGDFKWVRDNGVKLYCNKTGDWTEVVNSDNFLTSHFINGNANYQIIWTGEYYIIRPTDYDNGYNPTGAKGNIEIYDAEFNHIKSAELDNYILQMSYVDGKCYVLTDSNIVLYSDNFDVWYADDSNELPLNNGYVKIYKTLTKTENVYDYTHEVTGIINQNVKKAIVFEKWQGNKVDVCSDMYIRYDDSVISYSYDGIYWKDIYLPRGVNKIQKVSFKDNIITVTSQEIELSYSINDDVSKQLRTYVEVEGKILGFDVEPVIESDRTLVPLRFIFETMGANVDWEDATRTAIVKNDNATILFSIDNTTATVNSVSKTMDVPARLVNDKTMVPLRFLSEELGFNVEWDENTRTATISKY